MSKFTAYVVLAGLLNAAIAAFLFFRLPADHTPSFRSLLIRAMFYVAFSVLAGAGGARFYWNRFSIPFTTDPPLSFQLFALVNACAWVWVPAVVLLSRQDSPVSSVLSALGAALLADGLRHIIPFEADSRDLRAPTARWESGELFAATLYTPPRETHGYVIALCIYATGYFLINHYFLNAGAPFAVAAFLFAWKRTLVQQPTAPSETRSRAAHRLAVVAAAAVLVTLFVMLFGIGHRNRVEAALAGANGTGGDAAANHLSQGGVYVPGISGYQSIILWPVPEKPQIVAPVLANISPFAARTAKPLVIQFDGPYWYFQPPGQRPGPGAHEGRGNPLSVNIEANNFVPLNMEAVQNLASPIRLATCREVQVMIQNRDNLRGMIGLGVELTDSTAPGKPSVSLGQQTILSSQSDQFAVKLAPVDEVLRFTVPSHAPLRKFDQITVRYFPGPEHWQVGAKIAIDQFELVPR
ncbi:MAG TPA: hypothetical protein VGT08_00865 [Terracidiphilus sp.]|nr:hypothetical protein [Terracidiphilus sp.]